MTAISSTRYIYTLQLRRCAILPRERAPARDEKNQKWKGGRGGVLFLIK